LGELNILTLASVCPPWCLALTELSGNSDILSK
jgi:hypothetical protein